MLGSLESLKQSKLDIKKIIKATKEELISINEIGDVMAKSIISLN